MALLYIIPLIFGYFICTRVLREREILSVITLSFAIALVGILFLVNPLFYLMPLQWATHLAFFLMAAASIALKRKAIEPLYFEKISKNHLIVIVLCLIAIIFFTNYLQVSQLDDDYWIHMPLQGLFLKGQFPPLHPFFPYIELPGHYGRDLTISTLSVYAGEDFVSIQWIITTLIQPFIFLMIFIWIRKFTGHPRAALLAAIMIFFGVNVGSRSGLLDIIQNNNSFVYLYLFLLMHLIFAVLKDPYPSAIALLVAVLGIYPVVYESHYGLIVLTFITIAAYLCLFRGKLTAKPILICILIIALSLPIAILSGGFFTAKLKRAPKQQYTESVFERSNSQKVAITFPKKELFQIYMGVGRYQRVSVPFNAFFTWSCNDGLYTDCHYAPVWSTDFLMLVWFPFYLAPLTLFCLVKKRDEPGLFLWVFGFISFLVPAVVNFGPVFEEEYFRWEGAAGIGFAGAMGLSISYLIDYLRSRTTPPWKPAVIKTLMTFTVLFILINLIGAITYLNYMLVQYQKLATGEGNRVSISNHGLPAPLRLLIDTCRHFSYVDIDACRFLHGTVCKNDTIMRNFEENNTLDLFPESAISGLAGAFLMGHTFPPFIHELRASPFRMNARARAFWATGDTALLDDLTVHWLYVVDDALPSEVIERLETFNPCFSYFPYIETALPQAIIQKLRSDRNLRLVFEKKDVDGKKRLIFEYLPWKGYKRRSYPPLPADGEPVKDLAITSVELPESTVQYHYYPVRVTVKNTGTQKFVPPEGSRLAYAFFESPGGEPGKLFDRVEMPFTSVLEAGETREQTVYFVTPYDKGTFKVRFYLLEGDRALTIEREPKIDIEVTVEDAGKEKLDFSRQK